MASAPHSATPSQGPQAQGGIQAPSLESLPSLEEVHKKRSSFILIIFLLYVDYFPSLFWWLPSFISITDYCHPLFESICLQFAPFTFALPFSLFTIVLIYIIFSIYHLSLQCSSFRPFPPFSFIDTCLIHLVPPYCFIERSELLNLYATKIYILFQ